MVAIILVNYNGINDTIKCIESLLLSKYKDFCVIIVDNSANDISVNEISNRYGLKLQNLNLLSDGITSVYVNSKNSIILLSSCENLGFAAANNQGIIYLEKYHPNIDYFWLLNNDTIIEPETLSKLINTAKCSMYNVGIIGTNLLFMDNPNLIQALGGKYNRYFASCSHVGAYVDKHCYKNVLKKERVDYVVGASMLVKKQFVETVGYMEEKYFLYFEELDWILRGKQHGFDFVIDYDAIVYHKEGGSTKATSRLISEIADKCQLRNRILFTKKFYPSCLFLVLCSSFLTIVKRFINGHKDRSKVLLNVFCEEVRKICIRAK